MTHRDHVLINFPTAERNNMKKVFFIARTMHIIAEKYELAALLLVSKIT